MLVASLNLEKLRTSTARNNLFVGHAILVVESTVVAVYKFDGDRARAGMRTSTA